MRAKAGGIDGLVVDEPNVQNASAPPTGTRELVGKSTPDGVIKDGQTEEFVGEFPEKEKPCPTPGLPPEKAKPVPTLPGLEPLALFGSQCVISLLFLPVIWARFQIGDSSKRGDELFRPLT